MCIDGNSAPLSVRYLNAQLSALWQNARDCVHWAHHHGGEESSVDLASEDYVRHKYQRSLAQFHYMGAQQGSGAVQKEDLFFTATFGKPRLEFICNHEAALYIKIEKGHLNKAHEKSNSANKRLDRADNVAIEGLELAFRMKFSQSSMEGSDARIGHGKGYLIQLMILDFDTSKLVMFKPSIAGDIKIALDFYLRKYLAMLNDAGQNCLLNLPDFDDDAYSPVIDYSLTTKAIEEDLSADVTVRGTSVSAINAHLRDAWLKVASLTHTPSDKLSMCLAEIKTQWLGAGTDGHYHIHFAPPTIKALCEDEVIVYYNIEEMKIYEDAGFTTELQTLRNFSIAFIVNVIEEKTATGAASYRLDMETARFCRHLSIFTTLSQEIVKTYVSKVVEFVEETYLELIVEYELTAIYVNEPRYVPPAPVVSPPHDDPELHPYEPGMPGTPGAPATPGGTPAIGGGVVTGGGTVTVQEDVLSGFEQIITVTEQTVNVILKTLWTTAKKTTGDVLYKWSFENKFQATFEEPRIQLLSGGKALIWITLASGTMLLDNNTKTTVSGWRAAFEVNLKQVKHSDLQVDQSWFGRFKSALWGKAQDDSKTIEHVVLDFDTAVFIHELSHFDGVFDAGATLAVLKLKAIKDHMRAYLKAFAMSGYHIVHSTPVYSGAKKTRITATTFQVVSKTTITVKTVAHKHESAVIVVCGVTHDRPLPAAGGIKWTATLTAKASNTICLGHDVFLNKLLVSLAVVNAQTTIISRYPTASEEEWHVYLTTWAEHSHRKNIDTKWKLVQGSASSLDYQWEHHEVSSYERHGSFESDKSYNLDCRTLNTLSIPTTFRRGGMEIVVKGDTYVGIRGQDFGKKWSKRSSASWKASIRITSEWDGLHVTLANAVKPTFHKTETEGEVAVHMDTYQLLTAHMPASINMDAVLSQLKATLEGTYKYAVAGVCKYTMYSPVFNTQGDLILQLRPYDPSAKPPPPPPVAPRVIEMPTSPTTPGSRSQSKGPGPQPRPLGATKKRSWLVRKVDGAVDFIQGAVHRDGDDDKKSTRRTSSMRSSSQTFTQTPIIETPKPIGTPNGHTNGSGNGVANGKTSLEKAVTRSPTTSILEAKPVAVASPQILPQ